MVTDMWWRGKAEMVAEAREAATQGTKTLTSGLIHFFSEAKEVNQIETVNLLLTLLFEVENKWSIIQNTHFGTLVPVMTSII